LRDSEEDKAKEQRKKIRKYKTQRDSGDWDFV